MDSIYDDSIDMQGRPDVTFTKDRLLLLIIYDSSLGFVVRLCSIFRGDDIFSIFLLGVGAVAIGCLAVGRLFSGCFRRLALFDGGLII